MPVGQPETSRGSDKDLVDPNLEEPLGLEGEVQSGLATD